MRNHCQKVERRGRDVYLRLSSSAFSLSVLRSLIHRMQLNLTYLGKKLLPTAYFNADRSLLAFQLRSTIDTHLAKISIPPTTFHDTAFSLKKKKTHVSCSFFDVSLRRSRFLRLKTSFILDVFSIKSLTVGSRKSTNEEKC